MVEMQEAFNNINWGLIAPLIGIQLLLLIVAFVDLIRIRATNGPKWLWVLVILFVNIIGPIIYFVFGRRQNG
jgi:hydrogenase/urease accessory protein HupE